MEEKIKISLPKSIRELLNKDCEDFKILKKNGTPNMNAFINLLIVNFFEEFSASTESLHDGVREALFSVPEAYKQRAFDGIIKLLSGRTDYLGENGRSVTLAFKPTKSSRREVSHIENLLLSSESQSSFYRRMLVSYSRKTKDERERIIHKENYELLRHAEKRGMKVCITLSNGEVMNGLSVYSVAPSKDELFNYVLAYSSKGNHTVRLASVDIVAVLSDRAHIPEKNRKLFDRQVVCGAQYPMYSTDDEPIRVRLTEKGKNLFKKIYLYRPTPVSIDGDVYTFDCSASQVLYYFERFGENALIISPKRIGIFMRNYYHYALKKYRTLYDKE